MCGRALDPWQTAFAALGPDARGVLRREILPLEKYRTCTEKSDLGGWSPRETCTKDRSRSRCVHQRAQPAQPRHHGAAIVNGIVFPPCFIEEGLRITECYIRILNDVHLPHWTAREIQLVTWPPCSTNSSPLDFHTRQEWELALGDSQFTSQLELRAMIVRTVSDLDPEATEHTCTTKFIHKYLACVRAKRRPFRAPPVMDQLTCTRFFLISFDPS